MIAGERALDSRVGERVEHDAVELAGAADRDGAGRRSERGHDSGEYPIALLPVEAGDVEGDARALPERGPALELDVGHRRRRPTGVQRDPFGIERVDDVAGDRDVSERRLRIEGPRLGRERS